MSVSSSGAISTTGGIVGSTNLATTSSNTFTGPQYISSSFAPTNFTDTGSLYTDGGLRATKNSYFSSSVYINGDLIIFGSQSVNYITSSQLNIADNIITMNTSTPALRFGGIAVIDSGSLASGLTGSLLWDSQTNNWIYSNPSGSGNYDSAMVMMGPQNSGALGSEVGLTFNAIPKGAGGHHMTSSGIFESGSNVGIGTSTPAYTLDVIGTGRFTSIIYGTNGNLDPTAGTNAGTTLALNGNSVANNYSIGLAAIRNSAYDMFFQTGATNGGGYRWYIGTSEKMTMTNTGNVGIGTNTPNAKLSLGTGVGTKFLVYDGGTTAQGGNGFFHGFALDNPSNNDFTMVSSHTGALVFGKYASSNNTSSITETMRISNAGNVGIGTTTPLSSLSVVKYSDGGRGGEISIVNTAGSTGTEAALNFGFGGSSYNGDSGNAQIKAVFTGGNEVTDMVFTTWTGGGFTEKMRILGDGSVGIGTSSPSVKLHVAGTIYATKTGGTNSTPAIQVRSSGGGPRIQTYGLDADSRAWMGLGTDMAGNPYEHSVYFSAPDNAPSYGRQTFGSYDGTTYSVKMTILRDGSIGAPTGTNIYNPSDIRLKQNIIAITDGLSKINALNPVKFNWVEGFSPDEQGKDMLGFIAQEVQNIVPEAIENFSDGSALIVGDTTVENPLRVNEKFIIPVLVKAIQELNTKLDAANAEIELLKNK
jgi:hypothetical protein